MSTKVELTTPLIAHTVAKADVPLKETPIVTEVTIQKVASYTHRFADLIDQKLFPHLSGILKRKDAATKEADVKDDVNEATVFQLRATLQHYYEDISGNLYLKRSNEKLRIRSEHLLKVFDLVFFFEKNAPFHLANQGCYAHIEKGRQFLFRKLNNRVRIVQVLNYNDCGTGGEAHIYKVIEMTRAKFRAMRVPKDNTCLTCFMDASRVVKALRKLDVYPGFAKVLMTTTCNVETPTIMMRLYDGSLESCIKDIALDDGLRWDCIEHLIEIVRELHKRGAAHRDITSKNILYECTGQDSFLRYKFYLADFGNAACKEVQKHAHKAEQECPTKGTYNDLDDVHYSETITKYGIDAAIKRFQKQDVYALGLVLGRMIFKNEAFASVVQRMINLDPNLRPSMDQVTVQWHTMMKRGSGPSICSVVTSRSSHSFETKY